MFKRLKKKAGFLLIEGVLMLAVMTAVAFGMVSIMAGQFSTLSATKEANQAQQLAELIASILRQDGYDNVEDFDMQESAASTDKFVGNSDLKGKYMYTVKKLSEFTAQGDSNNKIKLMQVKIYPNGFASVPIYSLEVPLSSQGGASVPIGSVMAWPSNSTPTSGGVWLECNGQVIPAQYKKLREVMGDKTPNYAGVFLRGYGSQTTKANQGFIPGDKNQKFSSGNLGEIQTDATRNFFINAYRLVNFDDDRYSELNGILSRPTYLGQWKQFAGFRNPQTTAYSDGSGAYYAVGSGYAVADGYDKMRLWLMKRPPKRYRSYGNGNIGEYDDSDSGQYQNIWVDHFAAWNVATVPTASEIRPINIAVRYFIKAR